MSEILRRLNINWEIIPEQWCQTLVSIRITSRTRKYADSEVTPRKTDSVGGAQRIQISNRLPSDVDSLKCGVALP